MHGRKNCECSQVFFKWVVPDLFFINLYNIFFRWGYLHLETNPIFPDEIQAFYAGYAEGAVSTELIYNAWK